MASFVYLHSTGTLAQTTFGNGGIIDSAGTKVVEYKYDAWGKPIAKTGSLANTLGTLNPFRYRGYVYDEETGLYYVSSRFYNWTAGRWINSDDIAYLGADGTVFSNMLYAYCANSPVNKIDFDGNLGLAIGLFIGASALIGGLAGALTAACTGGNALEGALEGAALGVVAATATIVTPIIVAKLVPATLANATVTMINTGTTFIASGLGGMGVDCATQRISHAFSENSDEDFQLDTGRMLKTGFANGIAGVIPTFGSPYESVVNAVGSLAMGFDASFINAVIEIVTVRSLE